MLVSTLYLTGQILLTNKVSTGMFIRIGKWHHTYGVCMNWYFQLVYTVGEIAVSFSFALLKKRNLSSSHFTAKLTVIHCNIFIINGANMQITLYCTVFNSFCLQFSISMSVSYTFATVLNSCHYKPHFRA